MPARAVVFNGFRKHDGKGFRDLLPGEYTQMAGRAGRRGKDKVGTVIVASWTELPNEVSMKKLLTGTPTILSSQFRLTYNMMLNLLRANGLGVEDMMKKSFSEFRMQRAISSSDAAARLQQCERALKRIQSQETPEPSDPLKASLLFDVPLFFASLLRSQKYMDRLLSQLAILKGVPEVNALLSPGRVVFVHLHLENQPSQLHLGVLVGEDSSTAMVGANEKPSSTTSLLQTLRQDTSETPRAVESANRDLLRSKCLWMRLLTPAGGDGELFDCRLEKVPLSAIVALLSPRLRIQHLMKDFQTSSSQPSLLPLMRRNGDDYSLGKSKGMKKGPKDAFASPEEELKSIDRELLSIASSFAQSGSASFLDLTLEAKVRDFEFCEVHSSWLLEAATLSSCRTLPPFLSSCTIGQTWVTFLRCFPDTPESIATAPGADLFQQEIHKEWALHRLREKVSPLPLMLRPHSLQISALKYFTSNASLALFPDFQQRMKVLDHLGYIENSCQGLATFSNPNPDSR
jgi:hypothetical protein